MQDFKSFLPDTVMGTEKVIRSEKRALGQNDSSLKIGKKRPGEGVAAATKVGESLSWSRGVTDAKNTAYLRSQS